MVLERSGVLVVRGAPSSRRSLYGVIEVISDAQGRRFEADFPLACQDVINKLQQHHPQYISNNAWKLLNYCIIIAPKDFFTRVDTDQVLDLIRKNLVNNELYSILSFQKTVELFMRHFEFIPICRNLLMLFSDHVNNLNSKSEITKRFLMRVVKGMTLMDNLKDRRNIEDVIPFIRNIFFKLKDDATTVNNITSLKFVEGLMELMGRGGIIGRQDQHCILEILAITSCHSRMVSHALMRKEAVLTLLDFYNQYTNHLEVTMLDLTNLIWAIMPASPKLHMHSLDVRMREEMFRAPVNEPIWHEENPEGVWIPFVPWLNYMMERKYLKVDQFSFVDPSGIIKTIDFKMLVVINEATSRTTSITRRMSGLCKLVHVKKTKGDSGSPYLSNCFAWFAYNILCCRLRDTNSAREYYRCLEGLSPLLRYMTKRQYIEVMLDKKSRGEVSFPEGVLVNTFLKEPLTSQLYHLRVLGLQMLSIVMERSELNCQDLFAQFGITQIIHGYAQDDKFLQLQRDSDFEKKKWILTRAQEFYKTYGNDYDPIIPTEITTDNLEDLSADDILDTLSFAQVESMHTNNHGRKSEIIKSILRYLTKPGGRRIQIDRLRTFLKMFANIPAQPELANLEINNEPFDELLEQLNDMLMDFITPLSAWPSEQTRQYIYKSGIQTINEISQNNISICFNSTSECIPWIRIVLKVGPFTTIQNLENYVRYATNLGDKTDKYKEWQIRDDEFRIELYMDGTRIGPEITVYEAIRRFRKDDGGTNIFTTEHCMEFRLIKKIPDSQIEFNQSIHPLDRHIRERTPDPDIPEDIHNVLQLIDILYGLNKYWQSLYPSLKLQQHQFIIPEENFMPRGLDNLIENALMDPFNALIGNLTPWVGWLIEHCPFVLSLEDRNFAFRVLRLDRRRGLQATLDKYPISEASITYSTPWYPEVKMKRQHILDEASRVLRATRSYSHWAISFEGENGSGLGLTREMFTLVSRELQKADLKIWTASEVTNTGYIHVEAGLYPDFCQEINLESDTDSSDLPTNKTFETIGMLLGKAFMEGQLLDLPLALPIFKWILNQESLLELKDLKEVIPSVYRYLKNIDDMATERDRINNDPRLSEASKKDLIRKVNINGETVESYNLCFILPGREYIELKQNGSNIKVTLENAREYLDLITRFLLKTGVTGQMNHLRLGINSLINIDHLKIFHPEELRTLVCGENDDEYWSVEHLMEHTHVVSSTPGNHDVVLRIFDVMTSLAKEKRGPFLKFITGCPRLPVGGFGSLNPPFAISLHKGNFPYVQTCFHMLYTAADMTTAQFQKFINLGITEGHNYFGME